MVLETIQKGGDLFFRTLIVGLLTDILYFGDFHQFLCLFRSLSLIGIQII
jgi:hypothetical protein